MAFGVYVHIPYCVQRCHYCDFTTFEQSQIMPMDSYVELIKKEIQMLVPEVPGAEIDTIYFGGGTPSLLPAQHIVSIIDSLATSGSLHLSSSCEITIEINPATVDKEKLDLYRAHGINRYSVGAQTFHDHHLKRCGRVHSAKDTVATLKLLEKYDLNYSFDLLFALPHQSLQEVISDVEKSLMFEMNHLSAYCLTVPTGHPLSTHRAQDDTQLKMFEEIEARLNDKGILKYEISNFAKPGKESQHNLLYWQDENYWGVGLSAHSYFKSSPSSAFGSRLWNAKDFTSYIQHIESENHSLFHRPQELVENLSESESMSDFCHTHLRLKSGLPTDKFAKKFPDRLNLLTSSVSRCLQNGWVTESNGTVTLTPRGQGLSNRVFSEFHFSADDLQESVGRVPT